MRFGIIGTGFISDWFVNASRLAGGTPLAIYSRDTDRGHDFASRHGLPHTAATVDDLIENPNVDAIYVASPISSHTGQVATALAHGKHVLCEKTMTTSPEDVVGLYDLADRNGCILLEAVRPVHDPAYAAVKAALGRLGSIRYAHFVKCQYSSRYAAFLRGEVLNAFDPASGNSALRDLGVYCLHPALMLFGDPLNVTGADYHLSNGFQGGGSALLDYGSMSVTCTYSKTTQSVTPSVIQGELGSLTIDSIADPALVTFTDRGGNVVEVLAGPPQASHETLHYPIETFLRLCAGELSDDSYRSQTLSAETIISALLGSTSVHDSGRVLTGKRAENSVSPINLYTHLAPDGSRLGRILESPGEGRQ